MQSLMIVLKVIAGALGIVIILMLANLIIEARREKKKEQGRNKDNGKTKDMS